MGEFLSIPVPDILAVSSIHYIFHIGDRYNANPYLSVWLSRFKFHVDNCTNQGKGFIGFIAIPVSRIQNLDSN